MPRLTLLIALGWLVTATPTAVTSQTTEVALVVTAAGTGEALPAARVLVGGKLRGVTDAAGAVRVAGLPPGRTDFQIHLLGYLPRDFELPLTVGPTLDVAVELTPSPLPLDPLRVTARRSATAQRGGFYDRLERGHGLYVTRADLERTKPSRFVDVFRGVAGVRVISALQGEKLQMAGTSPLQFTLKGQTPAELTTLADSISSAREAIGDCPVLYYLDGIAFQPSVNGVISDEVAVNAIEGIEVYRRMSSVPGPFRRAGADCGVVLIWTRG
ncbi:hypothetical protein BH20GEM2_BH20GEM2_15050 [soil metagenome]